MRTSMCAAAAALGLAVTAIGIGPAFAQDNPPPPPPEPMGYGGSPGAVGPWSGWYLGGNLGWTGDTSDLSFRDLSSDQDITFHKHDSGNGILGGAHGGYNWWMGSMLAGIEGDIDWAKDVDYLASVRGRLGFGDDRWMAYGTAGVAFMGGDETFTADSATDATSVTFSRGRDDTGFVGGVGMEYALSRNVGLGVEGLWYDFGSDRSDLRVSPGEDFSVRDNRNFGVVRARLTWYLNQ